MGVCSDELIWGYQSSQTPDLRRRSSIEGGGREVLWKFGDGIIGDGFGIFGHQIGRSEDGNIEMD